MSRLLNDIRQANDSSREVVATSLSKVFRGNPCSRNKHEFELEALRQRGLTRLLNRHFNEAAHHVASERAAADTAQKDLERRRAQALLARTSNSPQAELSSLDAMYIKVNKLQKETRRKERETLLMYQRYVDTFRKDGKSQLAKRTNASQGSAAELTSKSEPEKVRIDPTYPTHKSAVSRSSLRMIRDEVPNQTTDQCTPKVYQHNSTSIDVIGETRDRKFMIKKITYQAMK